MSEPTIGQSVLRKEDQRFITGTGNYTDDINVRGQAYGYFVRSPFAHAQIKGIDIADAVAMDGVIAVLTGAELAADGLGALPCGWMIHSKDGSEMKSPAHPIMAANTANYAGEPLALVVAESFKQAKNAAELVSVDYAELTPVADLRTAQSA